MILLAASLWFVHPAPLDMPKAEAYLVTQGQEKRLEDRFDVGELWTSQAVLGRWEDDDGRTFAVARLDTVPPLPSERAKTRADYAGGKVRLNAKKDLALRDLAIARLSPYEMPEKPERPHQDIRGLKEVLYYEGTNSAVVCAFLPEKADAWYLSVWALLPEDDREYSRERFEEDFLAKWEDVTEETLRSERPADAGKERKPRKGPTERELLRADARHSVTNYAAWHVTDGEEFSVLDDLKVPDFTVSLTNDLRMMRARYAETMPSPIGVSNALCVARIFRDRDEYLDAIGDEMKWSAAYWSPNRRELVAYLPDNGEAELRKTIRHEAFHQYLSYACAMITSSPWLNEGYAQYFEDTESLDWELKGVELDFDRLAEALPPLLMLDYAAFYDGTDFERRLKYRLAWSIAVFLEKGAPEVRLQPFKDLKRWYLTTLLATQDMRRATERAFGSPDRVKDFVAEWKKYWKKVYRNS